VQQPEGRDPTEGVPTGTPALTWSTPSSGPRGFPACTAG